MSAEAELAELRRYLPLLRALKQVVAAAALDTAPEPAVSAPLTTEDKAEVESQVQRYLRRQERKR